MRLIDADALLRHSVEADRMGAMLVVGNGFIIDAPTIAPQPDPDTGLVPCGCGGKVDVAFYPGWHGVPDMYQVDCFNCHVGTRPCQTAEQAKAAWNTAMGWKGGAE